MKEAADTLKCGREHDLIGCIYGELDDGQMRSFTLHLQSCRECSSQLSGFKNIRESLVTWRDESLGSVSTPLGNWAGSQRPSALAAIREFFNLSPLWMKGAVAFASLLFCILAILAAARLRDTPAPSVATDSDNKVHSEQEFNARVARGVQAELERLKGSEPASVATATDTVSPDLSLRDNALPRNRISPKPTQSARRPLSKSEREELAADLRLVEGQTDGELELLADRINQ